MCNSLSQESFSSLGDINVKKQIRFDCITSHYWLTKLDYFV